LEAALVRCVILVAVRAGKLSGPFTWALVVGQRPQQLAASKVSTAQRTLRRKQEEQLEVKGCFTGKTRGEATALKHHPNNLLETHSSVHSAMIMAIQQTCSKPTPSTLEPFLCSRLPKS